jgi:hypothetical protein
MYNPTNKATLALPKVQGKQDSEKPAPPFTKNFLMNIHEAEQPQPGPRARIYQIQGPISTPIKFNDEKASLKSFTPLSVIGKLHDLSPFRTTCQKRCENSPLSPSFWKKINSSLKKTKQSAMTPIGSLFTNSHEKEGIFGNRYDFLAPHLEPSIFQNDLLLFPDLEKNIYDLMANDNPNSNLIILPHLTTYDADVTTTRPSQTTNLTSKLKTKELSTNSKSQPIKEKVSEDGCNCRNTKCLKLYCECLRKGRICAGHCNCTGCENHEFSNLRLERIRYIEKKNPLAFQPIITEVNISDQAKVHSRGCNCRKSNCLKNYCECHQFGARCTDACKCTDCKNAPSIKPEVNKGRKLKQSTDSTKIEGKYTKGGVLPSKDY